MMVMYQHVTNVTRCANCSPSCLWAADA